MKQRRYQPTQPRGQTMLLPDKIEDYVSENNPVRGIEAYVSTLDLAELGFRHTEKGPTGAGQPPYNPAALLKLYIYGYLEGIRSSRKLEKETRRNIEVFWLVERLQPSYKTISDFRKHHATQLKNLSRGLAIELRGLGLLGNEVAVDGSFFKADASLGSIETQGYVDRAIDILVEKIEQYRKELDEADTSDENSELASEIDGLAERAEQLKKRCEEKKKQKEEMKRSGQTQISTVDVDARYMKKRGKGVVGYNAQIAVDSKHKLVVEDNVVNEGNDNHQLAPMLKGAKEVLGGEKLTGLADAGYYEGEQIKECEESSIEVYVPVKENNRKSDRYTKPDFTYKKESDSYVCPGEKELKRSGKTSVQKNKTYIHYTSSREDCEVCVLRKNCLGEVEKRKTVKRWESEDCVERLAVRMDESGEQKMRQRGAVVEHVFGTLKNRCGSHQFLMRGLRKCRGEFSLMTFCYNIKRVLKIIGVQRFIEYCAQKTVYCPQTG